MIESLVKAINDVTDWSKIESVLEEIRSKVTTNVQDVDLKVLDILTILCSPLSPSHTAASNNRYPPGMQESNCVEEAVNLANLVKNSEFKRNLYDYAWCCGGKNLINEIPIDLHSLFLNDVGNSARSFDNFELLMRAMAIAAEEKDSKWKGNSINAINGYFEHLWAREQFADAAQFLEEIEHQLQIFPGLTAIFSEQYAKTIDYLESKVDTDFTCLMMLSRILELQSYRYKTQEKHLKAGQAHELMAKRAGNDLTKLSCLEKAEISYNNADSTENSKRVSVERYNLGKTVHLPTSEIAFPQEITKPIHDFSESIKNEILQMEFGKAIFHLGNDPFLVRFNESEFDIALKSPIKSHFDMSGIVTSIGINPDGRTSKLPDEIEYKNVRDFVLNWRLTTGIKLLHFNDLIFKLLHEDLKDVQNRFRIMVQYLSESTGCQESSYYKVNRILNAFRNSLHFDFLSMAIPYIEESLRYLLGVCHINPLQLKNEEGVPTQYKTLEFLFRDEFKNGLPENISFTLQMILTKGRFNVGLNLRNDIAHGILLWNDFDQFSTALLMVVMFILSGVCLWKKSSEEENEGNNIKKQTASAAVVQAEKDGQVFEIKSNEQR